MLSLEDGEEIRVGIDYEIKAEDITPVIYYNLPEGIDISKEQTGRVFNGAEDVGEYKINQDGRQE